MSTPRLPGFTAETSLLGASDRRILRPAGPPSSMGREGVSPAQRISFSPAVLKFFVYWICKNNCYTNCIQSWPGYTSECQGVAETCCKYGYHCTWCEP
jgi:hypothetical protein